VDKSEVCNAWPVQCRKNGYLLSQYALTSANLYCLVTGIRVRTTCLMLPESRMSQSQTRDLRVASPLAAVKDQWLWRWTKFDD